MSKLKKRSKAFPETLLLNYCQKPEKTHDRNVHIDRHLSQTTGTATPLHSFHPNMLTDVAQLTRNLNNECHKGTCETALFFRGRPQSAQPQAEGGKTQAGKRSRQIWSPSDCLSKLFCYSHSDAITQQANDDKII